MNKQVQERLDSYPDHVRPKMEFLRCLILDVAANSEGISELEETLKWKKAFLSNNGK